MDEVKAMTQAGETVGRAVGTGLRTLRRGAVQVAAVAEQKLADRTETVPPAATRRARRKASRAARQAPPEVVEQRRKWPWLLGIGIAVAGAATVCVLKSRQDDKPSMAEQDDEDDASDATPEARREQRLDGQPAHRA